MLIQSFIEESNRLHSVEALTECFRSAVTDVGFEHFAIAALNRQEKSEDGPAVNIRYPAGWVEHYFERNYLTVDPVVTRAAGARLPYSWSQLRDLSPQQVQMFNEAGEFGIHDGAAVPIHGPLGELFVAGLGTSERQVSTRMLSMAHMLFTQYYTAYLGLTRAESWRDASLGLSDRERECLSWSAHGKTSWDIGMIMSISEHTVNFHLRNAMTKLEASNRVLAVVKAIRLGLINP